MVAMIWQKQKKTKLKKSAKSQKNDSWQWKNWTRKFAPKKGKSRRKSQNLSGCLGKKATSLKHQDQA